jgi:hypothetical protein
MPRAKSACDDQAAPDHRAPPEGSPEHAAMLTTFNEVDMSAVMALRSQYKDVFEKKHGVKLGFMGFFTKAVIAGAEGNPLGQRRDRRHRHRLQELLPCRRRRRHR